ncbi:MAG: DUF2332 domain-containing protein [Candidatus Rokubacteria bacterium]|nr:DUF2332 domain-containing protein [Candidatus Rokubacteria bacterium]
MALEMIAGESLGDAERAALARRFHRFAEAECRGSSPLYEHLAAAIAADPELLALAASAAPGQPVPNLLLGAVHFLLAQDRDAPLARFYPSLTAQPAPPAGAPADFRAFCLARAEAIRHLLATRRVQTNEVGRSAYLLLAFATVAALANERPVALVEIGTSAGLNLLWDRYGYRYGPDAARGDARSPVQIACELRGERRPPLPPGLPAIARRVGIDLHVIDAGVEEEAQWLRALVWPEHRERAALLERAIEVLAREQPELLEGDGLTLLPDVLRGLPAEAVACVFHTHTLNQWPGEARERLDALLAEHAANRELYRIAAEWLGTPHPELTLTTWRAGHTRTRLLARVDPHGRWLEWQDTE